MTFAIEAGAEPLIACWRIKFKAVITAQGFLRLVRLSRIGRHKFYRQSTLSSPDRIRSMTATTNSRRLESERRNGILFDKDNNSATTLAPIVIEPSA
jgi:hypothetical protein